MRTIVARFSCFWIGLFVGAVVIFLIMETMEQNLWKFGKHKKAVNGSRAVESLKMVVVLFRHGNRGGRMDYPLDPYPLNDTNYWPYGANGLTPFGRVQAFKLGGKLRSLYNGFLPSVYYPQDIYATSDFVDRVIMSGQLVLAGLYPPQGWQIWNSKVNWQPIPLFTNSSESSEAIKTCPHYITHRTKAVKALMEKEETLISETLDYLRNVTGTNESEPTLIEMFDKIISEYTEGYSLPEWTKRLFPEPLTWYFGEELLALKAGSDSVVRIAVGNLVEEVVGNMERKANGTLDPNRKMYLYSTHDTTVLSFQAAIGMIRTSMITPVNVASALMLELHEDPKTAKYFVLVRYLDGRSSDLETTGINLHQCGDPCYLHSFYKTTRKFTGVDFDRECFSTDDF